MGPRPQLAPRVPVRPSPRLPVEVVRVRSRYAPPVGTDPLPAVLLDALQAIARELRHVPRDCIVDRAEMLHWLRRLAGRVDGVAALRVALPHPKPKQPPAGSAGALTSISARDRAEAVFGKAPSGEKFARPWSITDRKGRRVRVEFRKAQANGQTELSF